MPRGLIYFADPMCSWCWGFSDVIQKITKDFSSQLPVRVIMGGLYAGASKPLDRATKESIREHWQHVAELSGALFDYSFFDREPFIYNTEPACRAIVIVQQHEPASTIAFLKHLQEAFYRYNRDTTDREVLFEEAGKFGFNPKKFADQFDEDEIISETRTHFAITKQVGVTGFPTLLAVDDAGQYTITSGYQSQEKINQHVSAWLNESTRKGPE